MRVGDATFYLRFLSGLQANRERSERALASLADGKKVRVASDDPVGAQESLMLRKRLVQVAGFDRAAGSSRTALGAIDGALSRVFDVVTEARTLAMAGGSNLDDANGIRAQQIDQLREELLSLANTSTGGRYLFGGTQTLAPPFAADGSYSGNADEVAAPIDVQETVGATLSGSAVFVDGGDVFTMLSDLSDALRNGQPADVAALVPALSDALDHLGQVHGGVGARMQRIDAVLERHGDEELDLIRRISNIEDADLAEIAVELQANDTATSALSAASARVLGRSLFDYLG